MEVAAQPMPTTEQVKVAQPDLSEPAAVEVDPFAELDVVLVFHSQPTDEQMTEFIAHLNKLAGFLDFHFSFVRRFNRIHVCVSSPAQFDRARELVIVNLDRLNALRPNQTRLLQESDVIAQPGKRALGPHDCRDGVLLYDDGWAAPFNQDMCKTQ